MKKYLLIFIFVFLFSSLLSTFYFLIAHNKNTINPNDSSLSPSSLSENAESIKDFTQITQEASEKKVEKTPLEFIMPVDSNEIGMKFSNGQLIYSNTLQEWITHNGIDIVSKLGTPVLASENGKIIEISNTIEDGIKITIEHKDGYKTIYSNLSTEKMVQKNQEIKKGDVISGIGKTSTFEYNEKDHLHFEIYKDNTPINPLNLLTTPKKTGDY